MKLKLFYLIFYDWKIKLIFISLKHQYSDILLSSYKTKYHSRSNKVRGENFPGGFNQRLDYFSLSIIHF